MTDPTWQVWRDDVPRSAALNMALDEALLETAARENAALLRVYRWDSPSLSFGYFDRLEVVRARFPGRALVRRWTGGGAVDHLADVTFALAAPRTHPLGSMTALESYRALHRAVAEVLRREGVDARLAEGGCAPRGEGIAPCFVAPVCADVLVGSEKVAGGAQRRTKSGLLHQGSVQGNALAEKLAEVRAGWCATGPAWQGDPAPVVARAESLAASRYAQPEWLGRW